MKTHEPDPAKVRRAILSIVDNQLRNGDPPETQQTLDRLMAEGHSRSDARRLIGTAVASQIFEVLKYKRPYDHEAYLAALRHLPKMVWES